MEDEDFKKIYIDSNRAIAYHLPKEKPQVIEVPCALVAIYQKIKEYYVFNFKEDRDQFYVTPEINKLYELLKNKKNHSSYQQWLTVLRKVKERYPDFRIYEMESNQPGFAAKIELSDGKEKEAHLFIFVSLIGAYYTCFFEEKEEFIITIETIQETRLYVSPLGYYSGLFVEIESIIESVFTDHIFVCTSILAKQFSNIIVPWINGGSTNDNIEPKEVTVMELLFFNYDIRPRNNFIRRGDHAYKTNKYFLIEIQRDNLEDMRKLLFDKTTTIKEFS